MLLCYYQGENTKQAKAGHSWSVALELVDTHKIIR